MVPLLLIRTLSDTVVPLLIVKLDAFVPPIVRDLQVAEFEIVGWLTPVKLASPIMASTVAVGTPAVQLLALLQLVLTVPFQLVWAILSCGVITISRYTDTSK
jgi:hypothetical protein